MPDTLDVIGIAFRVLTALSHQCEPDPKDVAEMELFVGLKPDGMDLDEFAFQVIQKALEKRTNQRAMIM